MREVGQKRGKEFAIFGQRAYSLSVNIFNSVYVAFNYLQLGWTTALRQEMCHPKTEPDTNFNLWSFELKIGSLVVTYRIIFLLPVFVVITIVSSYYLLS